MNSLDEKLLEQIRRRFSLRAVGQHTGQQYKDPKTAVLSALQRVLADELSRLFPDVRTYQGSQRDPHITARLLADSLLETSKRSAVLQNAIDLQLSAEHAALLTHVTDAALRIHDRDEALERGEAGK